MNESAILLTGGSGILGRRLVENLLRLGNVVVTTTLSESSRQALLQAYPEAHRAEQLHVIGSDFSDAGFLRHTLDYLDTHDLRPTGLVNNARTMKHLKVSDSGLVSREDFIGELVVDVIAPYELTMGLALQNGSQLNCVVNVGSQYGVVAATPRLYGDPIKQSPLQYGVAKAALVFLTKELAVRLAPRNIRVNCVSFGGFEGRVDREFTSRYSKLCPSGRMLNAGEVFGPVEFLLSQASSSMTGHNLVADGGWTLW